PVLQVAHRWRMTQSGLKILVIDEEDTARQYIIDALKTNGYSVYRQTRGNEAEAWLRYNAVDLIYISLLPSHVDNLHFLQHLRATVPQTPIIVSSPQPQSVNEVISVWRAGIADYLTEPLRIPHLLQSIIRVSATYPSLQKTNSRFL